MNTHIYVGEGYENTVLWVFNSADLLVELFCRTLKDTWFISEYFLSAVSYRVIGAMTKSVIFSNASLCKLFLVLSRCSFTFLTRFMC